MSAPQRIQLRRTKGWRKPAGAVVVSRPTTWCNPFIVGEVLEIAGDATCWPIELTHADVLLEIANSA